MIPPLKFLNGWNISTHTLWIVGVITYPCWDYSWPMWAKGDADIINGFGYQHGVLNKEMWLLKIWGRSFGVPFHLHERHAKAGNMTGQNNVAFMMASSNGNIFRVTGPLCGEFTGYRWIPRTKASGAEHWCFLWSAPWINRWVNNREAGDLRRHRAHYDVIVMLNEQLNSCWWYMYHHNFSIFRYNAGRYQRYLN